MATKVWVGTDVGNEGAWSTAANWSSSGVPADGDTANLLSGTQGVLSGFAQSAITLARLNVGGTFAADLGASATPLVIGATLVKIATKNTANVYLQGAAPADDPLATVVIECQDADAVVSLAGYCTTVILRKGNLTITGTVGNLIVEPLDGDSSNCSFTVTGGTVTALTTDSGVGSVTAGTVTTLKATGSAYVTVTEATTTNIETHGLATVLHKAATTVASIIQYGQSIVDLTQDLRAKTITAWKKSLNSAANLNDNVTLTAAIKGLAGDDLKSSNPYGGR